MPSSLSTRKISWKFVSVLVKLPGIMSFKRRRIVGSAIYQKMRTPKLYVIKFLTKCLFFLLIRNSLQHTDAWQRWPFQKFFLIVKNVYTCWIAEGILQTVTVSIVVHLCIRTTYYKNSHKRQCFLCFLCPHKTGF